MRWKIAMEWHIYPFFLYPALPRVRRIMQAKFGVLSTTQHTSLPVKKKSNTRESQNWNMLKSPRYISFVGLFIKGICQPNPEKYKHIDPKLFSFLNTYKDMALTVFSYLQPCNSLKCNFQWSLNETKREKPCVTGTSSYQYQPINFSYVNKKSICNTGCECID